MRKLLLGETWTLPIGIALAVLAAWLAGGSGGLLLALLLAVLGVAVWPRNAR